MFRKTVLVGLTLGSLFIVGCPQTTTGGGTTVIFRDDFDGSLKADWTVTRQDPNTFSLTARPGFVRLTTEAGSLTNATLNNIITTPAAGDFILDSYVEFTPAQDRQLAGIRVVGTDGSGVVYGLTKGTNGRGLVAVAGQAGSTTTSTTAAAFTGSNVFLRLERTGDVFTASYSTDGTTFTNLSLNSGQVSISLSTDVLVGFFVTNGDNCTDNCDTQTPADFDFFQISKRN